MVGVINQITYPDEWLWKADSEILDEVKDQLFWSPFVDEDQVNVTVDDGVVTLRGNVDTWGEREAAQKNAYDAGARDVVNRLTVSYRTFGPGDYLDRHRL